MTSRDPPKCYEAVRSAILSTAWLLVSQVYRIDNTLLLNMTMD